MCHFVFVSFVVLDVMTFPDYVVFVVSSFQCKFVNADFHCTSRKHLRTKVTPDLHLTYSKNGGN